MKNSNTFLISAILMLIAICFVTAIRYRGVVQVVDNRLEDLPRQIGQWYGHNIEMESYVVKALDTDAFINRIYIPENSKSAAISFYIGYYGTKKGGRTGHNPEACLPSQGWTILDKRTIQIDVSKDYNKKISVNRLVSKNNDKQQIVYHWYQTAGGKVFSTGLLQNLNRLWTRILYNRDDGAYIQLVMNSDEGRRNDDESMKKFASEIYSTLMNFWPLEK